MNDKEYLDGLYNEIAHGINHALEALSALKNDPRAIAYDKRKLSIAITELENAKLWAKDAAP